MKIKAIRCKNCDTIIYSRTRHDFRWCKCKSIAIDGGFDYIKLTGNINNSEMMDLNINVTKKELYEDWATNKNKYGLKNGNKFKSGI